MLQKDYNDSAVICGEQDHVEFLNVYQIVLRAYLNK